MTTLVADSATTNSNYLSPWGDIFLPTGSTASQNEPGEFEEEIRKLLASVKPEEIASFDSPVLLVDISPEELVVQLLLQIEPLITRGITLASPRDVVGLGTRIAHLFRSLRVQSRLSTEWTNVGEEKTVSGTSALQDERLKEVEAEFRMLFAEAEWEVFEDGMENTFSSSLVKLISHYSERAVEVLSRLIFDAETNPEVSAQALRWVGRVNSSQTRRSRRHLLERGLYSSLAQVRDGAVLGLASMNDPEAMSSLETAIERERISELREDMMKVLTRLRDT